MTRIALRIHEAPDYREKLVLHRFSGFQRQLGKWRRGRKRPRREDRVVSEPTCRERAASKPMLRRSRGPVERLHVEDDAISRLQIPREDLVLVPPGVDVRDGLEGGKRPLVGPVVHELTGSEELPPAV